MDGFKDKDDILFLFEKGKNKLDALSVWMNEYEALEVLNDFDDDDNHSDHEDNKNDIRITKAKHKTSGKIVIIKSICQRSEEDKILIENEINVLKKLKNEPNIFSMRKVIFAECSIENDVNYVVHIIMEYHKAEDEDKTFIDIFQYVENKEKLPESSVVQIGKQLSSILHSIYCKYGLIHGDIKSENIIISISDESIYLIDFDASYVDTKNNWISVPQNCTHFYLPPEYFSRIQLGRDGKILSQPASVWAVGLVLYDMLNGEYPFDDEREILNLDFISTEHLNCDTKLKSILSECLKFNPYKRPNISELYDKFCEL